MRTHLTPAVCGIAAILVSLPAALTAPPQAASGALRMEFMDLNAPDAAPARRIGEVAIRWLGATLVREVSATLAKGGPEDAVRNFHLKTVSSGNQVLPGMPSVTAFKLTSLRLINAANTPDAAEQAALDRVRRAIDMNIAPDELLVQRLTAPDGKIEWRVYRPLAVLPSCLACHGDPTTQSATLRSLLSERAPENVATGYNAGEWRGLLRVTVAPVAPK